MNTQSKFQCEQCEKHFTQKKNLNQHVREVHTETKNHECAYCHKQFARKQNYELHVKTCERTVGLGLPSIQQSCIRPKNYGLEVTLLKSALKGVAQVWSVNVPGNHAVEALESLQTSAKAMKAIIRKYMYKHGSNLKYYLAIHVVYYKPTNPHIVTDPPVVHQTQPQSVYPATNLDELLESDVQSLKDMIETYQENGSGWCLEHIVRLDTNIIKI